MKTLFNKLRGYMAYRRIISRSKEALAEQFGIRVDWLGRMYTVLGMTPMQVAYGGDMIQREIVGYVQRLSNFLVSSGTADLFAVYAVQKENESSYLIVVGYAHMDPRDIGVFVRNLSLGAAGVAVLYGLLRFLLSV